jgi:hypothetical protein
MYWPPASSGNAHADPSLVQPAQPRTFQNAFGVVVAQPHSCTWRPFFYTLDLLLPVISYGQQMAFAPTGAYQWLSYALITAGWVLATTIITGISRALYRN